MNFHLLEENNNEKELNIKTKNAIKNQESKPKVLLLKQPDTNLLEPNSCVNCVHKKKGKMVCGLHNESIYDPELYGFSCTDYQE